MAPREKYPLSAAEDLREQRVDEAALVLSDATALLTAFEAELEKAKQMLADYQAETVAFRQREVEKDNLGRSAHESVQAHAFLDARKNREQDLSALVAKARNAVREQQNIVEQARGDLAQARAEHKAVSKHHESWDQAQRRRQQAKAEAEADDLISSRHGVKGRD